MCNTDVSQKLKFVQKQFLCATPVAKINWLNIFDNFNWPNQETLISLTLDFDLVLKYPLKFSYQQHFLKYIVNRLGKQGIDPSDRVYESFGRVVALCDSTTSFKHYLLENKKIITLKESSCFISEGTTGLCTWQASLALSEWCLSNSELLKNKRVLELGSGVGLTGLTIAVNCEPNKVYLTDGHPTVLKVLETNVKLNNQHLDTIQILNLPWESVTEHCDEIPDIDLLLAADVIYDSSLFPSLLNTIKHFFQHKNVKETVLACTQRNNATVEEFLLLLEYNNLKYREIDSSPQLNFIWSTECPIKLFLVSSLDP